VTDKLRKHLSDGQMLLPGTVTEIDVFRSIMSKIGRVGGLRRTAAQTESRRRCMGVLNAQRRERMMLK